jgi:hypothetical protein
MATGIQKLKNRAALMQEIQRNRLSTALADIQATVDKLKTIVDNAVTTMTDDSGYFDATAKTQTESLQTKLATIKTVVDANQ